jgi:hypothetical protein
MAHVYILMSASKKLPLMESLWERLSVYPSCVVGGI